MHPDETVQSLEFRIGREFCDRHVRPLVELHVEHVRIVEHLAVVGDELEAGVSIQRHLVVIHVVEIAMNEVVPIDFELRAVERRDQFEQFDIRIDHLRAEAQRIMFIASAVEPILDQLLNDVIARQQFAFEQCNLLVVEAERFFYFARRHLKLNKVLVLESVSDASTSASSARV